MIQRVQTALKNLLLAFVLVSIGYALGKHGAKTTGSVKNESGDGPAADGPASYVQVYYMHSTFRCASCNQIEEMTKELLQSEFAEEMAADKVKFSEVNFQEDEALAERFDIAASCVVVAKVEDGKITEFQRLDGVWELLRDPGRFNSYISDAVQKYLPGGNENGGGVG